MDEGPGRRGKRCSDASAYVSFDLMIFDNLSLFVRAI